MRIGTRPTPQSNSPFQLALRLSVQHTAGDVRPGQSLSYNASYWFAIPPPAAWLFEGGPQSAWSGASALLHTLDCQ